MLTQVEALPFTQTMIFLGLDIGSSTIKGGVLDTEQRTISAIVREPFPPAIDGLTAGIYEVAPPLIVAGVERVLRRLLDAAPEARGVLVSGQMGGMILVDAQGKPLTNYLSWRDQRSLAQHPAGGSYLEAARRQLSDQQFAELGSELSAGSTAAIAFCLAEHGQLPAGAIPATVGDFAIGQLCGVAPRMHPTHALGLLHLPTGRWHVEALKSLGLAQLQWPELANLERPIGDYSANGRHYPCYAALGDQQSALRGAGLQFDDLSLNISTGSQVSRRTSQLELGPYQTRPYFDGEFLNTITHLPAGRSLNVLVDLLTELAGREGVTLTRVWGSIAQAADEADGGGLACDLAFFSGPLGESGAVTGITTENLSVGNLFHAAFQNMADNYVRCANRLWPQRTWKRINVSGGLTQSLPLLRKMLQDRFAAPLCESAQAEETLLGLLDVAHSLAAKGA